MKLNAQERMPVCMLYSIVFWLLRMSPVARLGGMLRGRGGGGKEREREGGREGGR